MTTHHAHPHPHGAPPGDRHQHVFLGVGHAAVERRAWTVIALCTTMMVLEVGGGLLFGSLAVVADGLHMSMHAMAMLVAAFSYRYARKHANNPYYSFGTGKLGDLAGFSNAIVLLLVALFIAYEALGRFTAPVPIAFSEAIPLAVLGLVVNLVSAWLLGGGAAQAHGPAVGHAHARHHAHHSTHRDHNLRAIFMHIASDAAVSVLAIIGLTAARYLGWVWMDPLMGLVCGTVIAVWAVSLLRDTARVLLDVTPDAALAEGIRRDVETGGDQVLDLHLWRVGPGHLAAILAIATSSSRDASHYRALLGRYRGLSHVTIEVDRAGG